MNKSHLRAIITIAIPIIIQNLVLNLQLMLDRVFLGHVDSTYLSSIGNVIVPYNAISLFVLSAATGLTVIIAQNLGAKRVVSARKYAESSFIYSTIFSSLLFIVWLVGADFIFGMLGATGKIAQDAATFVRILAISLIFLGAEATAAAILQGAGHTRPIMIAGLAKTIVNIVLDWLLIFGNAGFPAMGLEGAALATLIANAVGAFIVIWASIRWKGMPFRCRCRDILRPSLMRFKKILSMGLPTGFESLLWFVGQLVLQRLLNIIDPMALAITSVDASIRIFGFVVYLGFARAAMTLVGKAWGAKNEHEVLRIAFICQAVAIAISLTWALIMVIFALQIAALFTPDPHLAAAVASIFRLSAIFIIVQSLNVVIGHAIRATGDTRWMLFSQVLGTVFVLSASGVFMLSLGWGIVGMYCVMILDELIRGLINLARFFLGRNPFAGKWIEWNDRMALLRKQPDKEIA